MRIVLLLILFLTFWASFVMPFHDVHYHNRSTVSTGPVVTTGGAAPVGIQNEPRPPIQIGRIFGLRYGPLRSSRKDTPRFPKWGTAVTGDRLQQKIPSGDEVEITFQCYEREDTKICEQEDIINIHTFDIDISNPEMIIVGCDCSNFKSGSDKMTGALSTMLNKMLEGLILINQFVLGCVGVLYRCLEINWPNQTEFDSTLALEMWPTFNST